MEEFPKALATDLITVLVKKVNGTVKVAREPRGTAATFSINVALPDITAADIEFVYAFANSADGKKASNSVYVAL
jgi:hypothetical protein